MSQIDIIRAGGWDVWSLSRLYRACFSSGAQSWLRQIRLLLGSDILVLKALAAGELVGMVALHPHRLRGRAVIFSLGVSPAWRKRGVGECLMRACELHAELPYLRLQVRAGNLPAIQLYHKLGYTVVKVLPRYFGNGDDAYVMEKKRAVGGAAFATRREDSSVPAG
ncbi:MAG TPA: N-acetyltransferase [Anaerolineae bacterium]|nr:N-acetyltransferase [Anaerolineae bacterium]